MATSNGKTTGWLGAMLPALVCLVFAMPVAAEDVKPPSSTLAVETCADLATLLARQDEKTSRELKQIKRDLAALSQQLEQPGLREIVGGVGYILGIFGVAAYVASRRKPDGKGI
jgi:hypothetical protein